MLATFVVICAAKFYLKYIFFNRKGQETHKIMDKIQFCCFHFRVPLGHSKGLNLTYVLLCFCSLMFLVNSLLFLLYQLKKHVPISKVTQSSSGEKKKQFPASNFKMFSIIRTVSWQPIFHQDLCLEASFVNEYKLILKQSIRILQQHKQPQMNPIYLHLFSHLSCPFICSCQANKCFLCFDISDQIFQTHTSAHTNKCTYKPSRRGRLIGWWMAGVVITEHPAESGLQDKDVLTGHFSV